MKIDELKKRMYVLRKREKLEHILRKHNALRLESVCEYKFVDKGKTLQQIIQRLYKLELLRKKREQRRI